MKKTLLISFLFSSYISMAQNLDWAISNDASIEIITNEITTDAIGNVYVTGIYSGTVDFDPGPNVENLTSVGSSGSGDIFIQKLDSSGSFLWAKSMGGAGSFFHFGWAITVDNEGGVYVTGAFEYIVDFDPGVGIFNLTSQGGRDIFIVKLDSNGNFSWANSMGSSALSENGFSISSDVMNNIYVSGNFENTVDFDPSNGVFNLTSLGGSDMFITKLDSAGNLIWAKSFESSANNYSWITVDCNQNDVIYLTGRFENSVDFDPGSGVSSLTSLGGTDIFIVKLDSAGNLLWVKSEGGLSSDHGQYINTDKLGNIYITGRFQGTADFDPNTGTIYKNSNGSDDMFIQKLDQNGSLIWIKTIGGALSDWIGHACIDTFGNVYLAGAFMDTVDFDPGISISNIISKGGRDIFIQKLDSNGNFIWVNSFGSLDDDLGSIALDDNANIYSTGTYRDTVDFDPNGGVFNLIQTGINVDSYILKLRQGVENNLSVNNASFNNPFNIYPNPTSSYLNINFNERIESVEIFNSSSKLIKKINPTLDIIDVSGFPTGIYFIKIVTNEMTITKKFVKQ